MPLGRPVSPALAGPGKVQRSPAETDDPTPISPLGGTLAALGARLRAPSWPGGGLAQCGRQKGPVKRVWARAASPVLAQRPGGEASAESCANRRLLLLASAFTSSRQEASVGRRVSCFQGNPGTSAACGQGAWLASRLCGPGAAFKPYPGQGVAGGL